MPLYLFSGSARPKNGLTRQAEGVQVPLRVSDIQKYLQIYKKLQITPPQRAIVPLLGLRSAEIWRRTHAPIMKRTHFHLPVPNWKGLILAYKLSKVGQKDPPPPPRFNVGHAEKDEIRRGLHQGKTSTNIEPGGGGWRVFLADPAPEIWKKADVCFCVFL